MPDHSFDWTAYGNSLELSEGDFSAFLECVEFPAERLLVIATLVLVVFWLRDYMCLRISPCRHAVPRSLAYGIAIVLTAVLILKVVLGVGLADFAQWLQSPKVFVLLIAVHIAASTLSIWIRRTQNYHWMWATALLPAPVVWLLLLQALLLESASEGATVQFSFFSIALLWAASMVVIIFRTRYTPMPLEDLDFAVLFGSLSHGVALCVFPLVLLLT